MPLPQGSLQDFGCADPKTATMTHGQKLWRYLTSWGPLLVMFGRFPTKVAENRQPSDLTQKSPTSSVLTPVSEPCPAPLLLHAVLHALF